ncbi:MAG: hypothetical protein JST59_29665 [Actinobacteria bacterium]|nr:hypothetical protein [Actinomycetota bacterium]
MATKPRRVREHGFEQLNAIAGDPGEAAAWSLLAHLRGRELRALSRARPALAAARRRLRRTVAPGAGPAPGRMTARRWSCSR